MSDSVIHTHLSPERVKAIVETALTEIFAQTRENVSLADLSFGKDHDGSDILNVKITFDGEKLQGRSMLAFASAIRQKLASSSEPAFPIVAFLAKKEYRDAI